MPTVSVILIGYRMADQLANTLATLSADYQRRAGGEDYEVVVVENDSGENLPAEVVSKLPSNIRYFLRQESSPSPVPAINFAFEQCRGDYIGLVMDGARMLSPGVIDNALQCYRLDPGILGVVPR